MKRLINVGLGFYSEARNARKIFSRPYEDLHMLIYYDAKQRFRLIMVDKEDFVLYEQEISRAQAFRIINTRS